MRKARHYFEMLREMPRVVDILKSVDEARTSGKAQERKGST